AREPDAGEHACDAIAVVSRGGDGEHALEREEDQRHQTQRPRLDRPPRRRTEEQEREKGVKAIAEDVRRGGGGTDHRRAGVQGVDQYRPRREADENDHEQRDCGAGEAIVPRRRRAGGQQGNQHKRHPQGPRAGQGMVGSGPAPFGGEAARERLQVRGSGEAVRVATRHQRRARRAAIVAQREGDVDGTGGRRPHLETRRIARYLDVPEGQGSTTMLADPLGQERPDALAAATRPHARCPRPRRKRDRRRQQHPGTPGKQPPHALHEAVIDNETSRRTPVDDTRRSERGRKRDVAEDKTHKTGIRPDLLLSASTTPPVAPSKKFGLPGSMPNSGAAAPPDRGTSNAYAGATHRSAPSCPVSREIGTAPDREIPSDPRGSRPPRRCPRTLYVERRAARGRGPRASGEPYAGTRTS